MMPRTICAALLLLLAGIATAAEPVTPMPPAPLPPPLPPAPPGQATIWLVGDSTMHNGTKGEVGWGEPFIQMFDADKVRVVNRAMGGRSSRTFQSEGRWDAVVKQLRKGDVVLIQFGHNDAGALVDPANSRAIRDRGSIRGIGDESQDVTTNAGRKETVHSFGWYLRKYVADARAKGATPVICSWVPHCPKPGDKVEADPAPSSYRQMAAEVAAAEKAYYIDLYALVWHHYVGMTPEQIKATYFTDADNTHTSPAGAKLNASCVVEGLKLLKDMPIVADLKGGAP
jgi:rhamnogalacturonan acetylesterase